MSVSRALIVLTGVIGFAGTALAAPPPPWSTSSSSYPSSNRSTEYDYARVRHVEPIVRQVRVETPRRECYDDRYVESRPDPNVGARTVLGGIIGGVLGHQIGSGRGRDAATVAGAVIGAKVGHDAASRNYDPRTEERVVQRCEVRYDNEYEERIDGYRVTYEYNGREYTTRMPYDPGDRIRVRVAVAVAE
jgi:uncharacterized protein YcfJ